MSFPRSLPREGFANFPGVLGCGAFDTHLRLHLLRILHLTTFSRLNAQTSLTYSNISFRPLSSFFLIFILCFEHISFQMQCPRYPISHYSGSNSLNAEKQSSYLVFTTVKPSDATEGQVEEWRMLQLFRTAPLPVTIRDQHSRSPLDHAYLPALIPLSQFISNSAT